MTLWRRVSPSSAPRYWETDDRPGFGYTIEPGRWNHEALAARPVICSLLPLLPANPAPLRLFSQPMDSWAERSEMAERSPPPVRTAGASPAAEQMETSESVAAVEPMLMTSQEQPGPPEAEPESVGGWTVVEQESQQPAGHAAPRCTLQRWRPACCRSCPQQWPRASSSHRPPWARRKSRQLQQPPSCSALMTLQSSSGRTGSGSTAQAAPLMGLAARSGRVRQTGCHWLLRVLASGRSEGQGWNCWTAGDCD